VRASRTGSQPNGLRFRESLAHLIFSKTEFRPVPCHIGGNGHPNPPARPEATPYLASGTGRNRRPQMGRKPTGLKIEPALKGLLITAWDEVPGLPI